MKTSIFCNNSVITLAGGPFPEKEPHTQIFVSPAEAEMRQLVYGLEDGLTGGNLLFWSGDGYRELLNTFFGIHRISEAAGGVVFNEEGDILFIHRNGNWDLPKGKISRKDYRKAGSGEMPAGQDGFFPAEGHEAARLAAVREVREETGLETLEIISPLPDTYHFYRAGDDRIIKRTYWFRMKGRGGEKLTPQASEGIIIARWIPAGTLGCVFAHTYESLKPLIRAAEENMNRYDGK